MLVICRHLCNLRIHLFLAAALLFLASFACATSEDDNFPLFPVIADNVVFWENIYAKYTEETAILHDREDLSIIYTIIPLVRLDLPGARQANRKYLKIVKKRYTHMLSQFAKGEEPDTVDEKRIFSLFSPPEREKKFKAAAKRLRIQTGLKKRFVEGVVRSGAYMEEMKKIFKSYGIPEDLAYLTHVESSFNPKARSKYGASGVWQFTRSTGKNLMTISYIVDERLDILAATHAAAKYLKGNYDKLGSWPLAITAYNYGRAGMMRAAAQEGGYENIFLNYQEGHFKFASKNFYAEFLAARRVAQKYETADYIPRDPPPKLVHFKLPGYASAADLAKYFQLSREELEDLNLSLLEPVWRGEKYIPAGYPLRLPQSPTIITLTKLVPDDLFKTHQKRSKYYRVRKGDTAGLIAQRFEVSLQKLIRANGLGKKAVVYVGQKLRIPPRSSGKTVGENYEPPSFYNNTLPVLKEKKKGSAS